MWEIFISFFKIGLFTFGGGYAMLPVIRREVVEKRRWCADDELLDCYAVAQCTPGVIAVNTATFVGYKKRGVWGGIIATAAVILPSLILITLVAAFLRSFAEIETVQHALAGIRAAVAALVLGTVIKMFRKSVKGAIGIGIFFLALILSFVPAVSSVYIVAGSIVLGLLLGCRPERRTK